VSARLAGRLGKAPVELAVVPAAHAWEVGRPIAVRVVATGRHDATIREARAELVMMLWLGGRVIMAGPWGAVPPSSAPERIVTGTGRSLSLGGDLRAGTTAECQAELPNWAQAPTGGKRGEWPRIEYAIRAEARLAGGMTVQGAAPVVVVSGPDLYQEVEGVHRPSGFQQCDIELVAPPLRARPGETLRGTVRVSPRRPIRARSVRLLVIRTQTIRPHLHVVSRRTLARRVELARPQEFGFEAPLPAAARTVITPQVSVHWLLRAIVRYGLVADDRLDAEVNVYTQR
jgi:hypothetical protein